MVLLKILLALFCALFLLVWALEKYGSGEPSPMVEKMSRYIFPLMMVLMILQLVSYAFF